MTHKPDSPVVRPIIPSPETTSLVFERAKPIAEAQTVPLAQRIASSPHVPHTREALDGHLAEELRDNVYKVSPKSFLDAFLPPEASYPTNGTRWSAFVEILQADNEIQEAIRSMNNARAEDHVYKPFARIANRVTTLSKKAFASDVKRQVVFHGLGKTHLKGPPCYHAGKVVPGTESDRKPDGLAILCDNEQESIRHLDEANKANPPADTLGINWRTSLLVIEHRLTKEGANVKRIDLPGREFLSAEFLSAPSDQDVKGPTQELEHKVNKLSIETDEGAKDKLKDPSRAGTAPVIAAATPHVPTGDEIQLASCALDALCVLGNRTHAFGLFLDRCHAAFWYFDRSGAICSSPFYFPIALSLLASFLTAFTFADSETLGFNPDFQPPVGVRADTRAALAPSTLAGFTIPFDGSSVILREIIHSQYGLVGRGTLVYSAELCRSRSSKAQGESVVAKLAWQVTHRRNEWEWVDEAVESGYYKKGDFPAQYEHRVFRALSECLRGRFGLQGAGEDRELRLLVMEQVSPVKELTDTVDVLFVFRRYIEILYNLYDANVYHRDISIFNLGFRRVGGKVDGVIFDFDHAQHVNRSDEGTTSQHISGTLPFVAIHLLADPSTPYLVRFDVESVMWAFWWLVLEPDGVTSTASTTEAGVLEEWYSGSLKQMMDSKWCFLTLSHPETKILRLHEAHPQLLQLTKAFEDGYFMIKLPSSPLKTKGMLSFCLSPHLKLELTRHVALPRFPSTPVLSKLSDPAQNSHDLALQLRSLGLYAASTLGDGNCLFRALCDQLYGSSKDHLTLRREICDWMDAYKEHYQGFVEDGRTWDHYIASMRQAGTYGGHLELSAFAHLKRRNVKVIQPGLVYVIEWSTGPNASSIPSTSATRNEPAASSSDAGAAVSTDSALSSREQRRARRERLKEAKELERRAKLKEVEITTILVANVEEAQSVPPDNLPAIYVAYHDWEHFSSVRNLVGPHQGIPNVIESSAPLTDDDHIPIPPPPPTRRSKRTTSTSLASITLSTPESNDHRSPSPATTSSTARSTESSSAPSSISPRTPPDSVTTMNAATAIFKGRSPKRSFDESDEVLNGEASGSEYGRAEPKRTRGDAPLPCSVDITGDQEDTEAEGAAFPPPGLSPVVTTDEADDDDDDAASAPDSTTSYNSASASSASRTRPNTRSSQTQAPLTKRQAKKLGVTRPKPKRVVLLVGKEKKQPDKQGDVQNTATAKAEWLQNGTGKMDVRGFRELKI
ncbi:hypothetical protein FRB99_003064 [Tulasnella sp. 403]|nr:hypothetical protein FRB99_003064 [Tulasnella sp. 403]